MSIQLIFLGLFVPFLVLSPLGVTAAYEGTDGGNHNVLFINVDNMRPSLSIYNVTEVLSPNIDSLVTDLGAVLFSRAYCQLAWCAPSRNSFLTGQPPDVTGAWNFLDSFREEPPVSSTLPADRSAWITMPQFFKEQGYYTTSVGKIFHPRLPSNFDYPYSWSDEPYFPVKPECPNSTMSCSYPSNSTYFDVDRAATVEGIRRLEAHLNSSNSSAPFFLAVGLQGPRLPWSFPEEVLERYPNATSLSIAKHQTSLADALEWFRPTEVNMYNDIRNITHKDAMSEELQHQVRLAYYATITHVDDQVGTLLNALERCGLMENTVIVLASDHGQNLGEHNMWSMMNLMETSMRVPLIIRSPSSSSTSSSRSAASTSSVCSDVVELLDLYPTLVSLAGLPAPLNVTPPLPLPGSDLSYVFHNRSSAKTATQQRSDGSVLEPFGAAGGRSGAAFGQITRCRYCALAYLNDPTQCLWDAIADANYTVPCAIMPRLLFNWMGLTVRTASWRYTTWCPWNGTALAVTSWEQCKDAELYDHRNDDQLYNIEDVENVNLVNDSSTKTVQQALFRLLQVRFFGPSVKDVTD